MKKTIFVLLILLCLFSLLFAKRIVKIGTYENPPKIYTDENGKVSGFWADITNYIAKQENWEIKWVHGNWQECLERLKNNDIDIMVDVADTPEREKKYTFSNESVLLSWTRIYRQKGSDIKSILDLKGKTIAGLKSSFDLNGPEGLKAITQKFEIPCKIIEMENYNRIFSALENRKIDAGIVDKDFGNINEMKFHIERTPIVLQPAKMLYAFPKNAPSKNYFINRIDHHIANLKKDNRSIYYTAFDEFFGRTKKITVIPPWLLWLIGFSAILIVLVTIFNISLKYQVNKKTLALKKDIIKRKQIQKKLSENEERLRTLINSTPDIICFKDGKGRWLEANTADLELFSLQNVDYKLKTDSELAEFTDPIYKDAFLTCEASDKKTWQTKKLHRADETRPKSNGEIKIYDVIKVPIFEKDGKRKGIVVLGRDITEAKRAEEALKEAQSNLQALLDNWKTSIWSIDKDYNYNVFNKSYANLIYSNLGIRLKKGMNAFEIHPKEIHDFLKSKFEKVFKGEFVVFEFSDVLEGKERFFEIYMNPINTNNKVSGLLTLSMDITERKLVEEALIMSEERFRKAFTTSPDSININRLEDGLYVSINDGFTKITGYSESDVIGKTSLEINIWVNPEDRERLVKGLRKYGRVKNLEAPFCMKDGKIVYGLMSASVINLNGVPHIISITRDITERKKVEEELKKYRDHLEEMVKERTAELEAFSYSISHDLKAPLRAIDGFTRILMEDYIDKLDDEAKRIGSIIQKNSQKMGQLIDDLLRFSKLGRISMHFSNIDMKNMAIAIYNELTTSQQRERISFSIDELPDIYGEPSMFRQVWTNLISNAIKFSSKKESPMISIKCEENETGFIYSISDNGAGFDTRYKDKLFGVFQRLHSEKDFPGTGVGLAIVQRIINRHSGKVWAESELGKGAIFYFSLPKRSKREAIK